MSNPSPKTLYRRAQFLHLLNRDLERLSGQLDSSRVIRFTLRRLGEELKADLVVQVDVRRADRSLERPYILSLTPRGGRFLKAQPAVDVRAAPAGDAGDPATGVPATRAGDATRPDTGVPAAPDGEEPRPTLGSSNDLFNEPFLQACRTFLARPLGPVQPDALLLKVEIEDRPVAILCFRRPSKAFSRTETEFGREAAAILSQNLRQRERERVDSLKERIYAKILSENRPQDVLYQIIHGLKRLLQYDHGAAVLLLDREATELSFQAESIAWTKAKSDRIGRRIPLDAEARAWLDQPRPPLLLRAGEPEAGALELPRSLLAPLTEPTEDAPRFRGMIVGTLRHRSDALGILQIRSRSAAAFNAADLRILEELLPLASVTLYNSTMYKTQHDLLVSAERKNALADLARAISHDLNNAFGVILPLLQTLRRDMAEGPARPEQLARDLEVIEHYARMSARIFQGLLSASQGATEPARWTDLNGILEGILRMLGPSLEAQGIRSYRELMPRPPTVFLRRGEMERLFLNLIYNARDAMPKGGALTLRTQPEGAGMRLDVIDTGEGIPDEIRKRIFEPFFTTKASGSGLGLDISRSIVWDYDGRLELDSTPGHGTRVSVWLPRLAERLRPEAERATPGAPLPPPEPNVPATAEGPR